MHTRITSRNSLASFVFLCIFAQAVVQVSSENILFFFGVSSYSHRIPAWPLAKALAEKGHNVTFVSPYPAKRPNPKVYDYVPPKLKEWVDNWGEIENVFENRKTGKMLDIWFALPDFGIMMCEAIYNDEGFLNWVKTTQIDLIILDSLSNDCALGMAHKFGAKVILFDTSSPFTWYTDYGLPDETSTIPSFELGYPADMTFIQRVKNALLPVAWQYLRRWKYFPVLEKITREKLEIPDLPSFEDMDRNTSLIFLNTHYAEEFARSLPPNMIPIGGIAWSEKRNALPKEMAEFLEKGNGFIYISFGTYADFNLMDKSSQQAIIGSMRSFPKMQFVWKVDNDSLLQEFPQRNVYINKWMPQQDILAHPKIRAFITHAGLMSIQEAIYSAVPLISFPIFAEQDYNAERIHRKEYGIRLEIINVKQEELEDAINRILDDPKYRDNMKKVSAAFKDRPQKPLEVALWWTDYVLRHSKEDLAVLRPLSVNQPWWKRRQLDVWMVILSVVGGISVCMLYLLIKIVQFASSSKTDLKDAKKKIQ